MYTITRRYSREEEGILSNRDIVKLVEHFLCSSSEILTSHLRH